MVEKRKILWADNCYCWKYVQKIALISFSIVLQQGGSIVYYIVVIEGLTKKKKTKRENKKKKPPENRLGKEEPLTSDFNCARVSVVPLCGPMNQRKKKGQKGRELPML